MKRPAFKLLNPLAWVRIPELRVQKGAIKVQGDNTNQADILLYYGGRHSMEEAFVLPFKLSRVRAPGQRF